MTPIITRSLIVEQPKLASFIVRVDGHGVSPIGQFLGFSVFDTPGPRTEFEVDVTTVRRFRELVKKDTGTGIHINIGRDRWGNDLPPNTVGFDFTQTTRPMAIGFEVKADLLDNPLVVLVSPLLYRDSNARFILQLARYASAHGLWPAPPGASRTYLGWGCIFAERKWLEAMLPRLCLSSKKVSP